MTLLRFLARSLVASAFIADGISKVTHPDESAEDAERFTSTVSPLVQRVIPCGYASWVPDKPETWVRAVGGVQILGGAMFASGAGRRLGALLLAKASLFNIALACPSKDASREAKRDARPAVLTQVALLGTTLLAAQDLQGRPSLAWRAENGLQKAEKKLAATTDELSRKAQRAGRKAKKAGRNARRQTRKLGRKLGATVAA